MADPVQTPIGIDLLHVPPTPLLPYHTVVTLGMADHPMSAPAGSEYMRFAELAVHLPAEWELDPEALRDERRYWPLRLLRRLAKLPVEQATWLWIGHTIPNGELPSPYAPDTTLASAMLLPPLLLSPEFQELELKDGRLVMFHSLVFLTADELRLRCKSGAEALIDAFERGGTEPEAFMVLNKNRPALRERRRWFLW